MKPIDELDQLSLLIKKYNLPLSPILEYAINEKKEEFAETDANQEPDLSDLSVIEGSDTVSFDDQFSRIDLPNNADVTDQNKYILKFCYGVLCDFQYALTDREKKICELLLIENAKKKATNKYNITEERIRQIFIASIQKISTSYHDSMAELSSLRDENNELKNKNYLLEKEIKTSKSIEHVQSIQNLEAKLSDNAINLLNFKIEKLPLSIRTLNSLRSCKISLFKEIPQLTNKKLQNTRNCGHKTILELGSLLSRFSLHFGMSYEDIVSVLIRFENDDPVFNVIVRKDIQNNEIEVPSTNNEENKTNSSPKIYDKIYLDIATDSKDKQRLTAVLDAICYFDEPATPRDIARRISRSAWGDGTVSIESVDTILKRLPEVEYVPWGKYILKDKYYEPDR